MTEKEIGIEIGMKIDSFMPAASRISMSKGVDPMHTYRRTSYKTKEMSYKRIS